MSADTRHNIEESESKLPDAFVILFFIIVIATAMTYVLPQGKFSVATDTTEENGESLQKTRIVEGSFELIQRDMDNTFLDLHMDDEDSLLPLQ